MILCVSLILQLFVYLEYVIESSVAKNTLKDGTKLSQNILINFIKGKIASSDLIDLVIISFKILIIYL